MNGFKLPSAAVDPDGLSDRRIAENDDFRLGAHMTLLMERLIAATLPSDDDWRVYILGIIGAEFVSNNEIRDVRLRLP